MKKGFGWLFIICGILSVIRGLMTLDSNSDFGGMLIFTALVIFTIGMIMVMPKKRYDEYDENSKLDEPEEAVNEIIELPERKQIRKIPPNFQNDVKKYENLRLIKGLLDDGILTQEEFDKEKQKMLEY